MTRTGAISLLVGLAATFFLVAANDPEEILRLLSQAGWGMAVVVALHLPQILLSALAWAPLIDDPRRPGWAVLSRMRWIREAVNNLLPVAQVGGEFVRAQLLLRRGIGATTAAASIAVDLAAEMATQVAFAAIGLLVLALIPHEGRSAGWVVILGAVTFCGAMSAAFVVAQRWGLFRLLDRLLPWLERSGWAAPGGASGLHEAVAKLYRTPRRLWLSGAGHLASWLLGTLEVWAALHLLGAEAGLAEALVIESLGQALRNAAFVVPGGFGVQEGGLVLVCALFGIPAEQAIALSLIRRVRDIVLGVPGLIAWRWELEARDRTEPAAAPARNLP